MPWHPESRIPVTVLGATGVVGQELARRVQRHPWFDLRALAGSPESAGLRYGNAARGNRARLDPELAELRLVAPEPASAVSPIVLSALDAESAAVLEPRFAEAGALVISNAGTFRMEPDVPLVVPEINPGDLGLLARQRAGRGWPGAIVCNPNCVAAIVGLPLAALHTRWPVRAVSVTTLQSVSGAGHPGVSSLDILGNVVPWIRHEEEKIEEELGKLLGSGPVRIGAQAHRVPVLVGHLATVSLAFEAAVDPAEAADQLRGWRGDRPDGLPSLPEVPIAVTDAPDRPQPLLDEDVGSGMTVTVGRIRTDPVLSLRFVVCGNNLIRGAAGAALANAELAVRRGAVTAATSPRRARASRP